MGGVERVTLTTPSLPSHDHALAATPSDGNSVDPTNRVLAAGVSGGGSTSTVNAGITVSGDIVIGTGPTAKTYNIQNGVTTSTGTISGGSGGATSTYSNTAPTVTMNDASIGNTGGGQSHENMPPFLILSYHIAMVGTFPSRN